MAVPFFAPADLRNIALVGHGACGKTSLAEAMLFCSGATTRLGSTVAGTSTFDHEPEEVARGGSIQSAVAWLDHEGKKVHVIDTPGDASFAYDALAALRVADAAVVVVSTPDGVEVGTERMFRAAGQLGLPRVIVLTRMDRDRADPERALDDIRATLGVEPLPLQLPLGREGGFRGVVSLFQRKVLNYRQDGSGAYTKEEVPSELRKALDAAWEHLVETVASTDDALLEVYLETFELPMDRVRQGFASAVRRGAFVPVLYASGTLNIGLHALLDLTAWALPSPLDRSPPMATDRAGHRLVTLRPDGPFVAQVAQTSFDDQSGKFSLVRVFAGSVPQDGVVDNVQAGEQERLGTVFAVRGNHREVLPQVVTGDIVAVPRLKATQTGHTLAAPGTDVVLEGVTWPPPMMSYAIMPRGRSAEEKLKASLERLLEEDPTLSTSHDALSGQVVLSGMGQAHLELAVERLRRKFKVEVDTALPAVAYRETLARKVTGVEGRHKKQTGGAGQFGVCVIDVEPLPRGAGFEFVDRVFGGAIPRQYIPSVEKGVRARMERGFVAGYPMVDIQVTLTEGKYHPVDSKDVAFQMAGSKALKAACERAGVKLLEPVYRMEIVVPVECMGEVMGDVTGTRRGRVVGMDTRGRNAIVTAVAPLAEIQRYAPDLRSMTGGRGSFTMVFEGYEDLPAHLVDGVVRGSPFRAEEEED